MNRSDRENSEKKEKYSLPLFLLRAIPNISIVLAVMSLTFLIINIFNKPMHFVDSELSCAVFMALGVASLITSAIAIFYERTLYSMLNSKKGRSEKNNKK